MKKIIIVILTTVVTLQIYAQEKLKMNFTNEQLTKIIEHYSKSTGQKFIIDATVRGATTILNNDDVTYDEAFNEISEALAINGFAIVKKDNVMTIKNARSAQRDGIEVSTELPKEKPERMATWIVTLQNISAGEFKSQISRMLISSYGEIESNPKTNQIIITDWTSTLNKVAKIIKDIDVINDPKIDKIIEKAKKERDERRKFDTKFETKKDKDDEVKKTHPIKPSQNWPDVKSDSKTEVVEKKDDK